MSVFEVIDDDALIYVFSFLRPPDIIAMRKTCKRMFAVSNLQIVWTNACNKHILKMGYPFSPHTLESLSLSELEHQTYRAYHLASRWLSGYAMSNRKLFIEGTSNTSVSEVRFMPGHDGQWILTVSKSIWDMVTIWDVSSDPRKCCEWSPRGAIFNGLALNSEPSCKGSIAISVLKDGEHTVEILGIDLDVDHNYRLHPIRSINTTFRPVTLQGTLLAIGDDISETVIWDWTTGASASLQHPQDEADEWQHDKCIQVVFAYESILVARARSLHLFPNPELHSEPKTYGPIARHSFGWVDGICVTSNPRLNTDQPLTILVRGESDDPWSANTNALEFYTLAREPTYPSLPSPYIFPPELSTQVASTRGSLRCRDVILGPCGTAIWIQPQDRAVVGLVSPDEDFPVQLIHRTSGHESIVAAVFPGPLRSKEAVSSRSRTLFTNRLNNWTSLDYDETLGKIALGSSFGRVMVLEL
ncbi:hypothetical protein BDZ94DRAFT_1284354 [Collybia nuda]|uniref:F-box domain-containing protein n=1 Tax=Collybia nuda TaxID=64659 RepID=A0A9P5XZD9_9AGAR|nr:hypothetical protein BDZ94DRAFT_1284354 [Collybia nuda]